MCKISQEAIYDILAKTNIFIIKNSRICASHLDEKGFLVDRCLNDIIPLEGSVFFYENYVQELIENLIESKKRSQLFCQYSRLNPIEENSLRLLSLKKNEFLYIFEYVNSKLNNSQIRTKEQALFIYMLWLRTGMTMEVLKLIFNLN
jgi:hypothetical protein